MFQRRVESFLTEHRISAGVERIEYLESVKWRRSDLSFFLVHLTKEDKERGLSAKQVLEEIISPDSAGYCTLNGAPQGLFERVASVPRESITAVSFTEAPLDQVKHFAQPIPGDKNRNYSKFGLVFEQDFIRSNSGNPCFYLNTRFNDDLKKAALSIVDCPHFSSNPDCVKLLPYFSIFGKAGSAKEKKEIDFYWEREWRVPGSLRFRLDDLFVGLCEHDWVDYFEGLTQVPFICPDWNYDRILKQLRDWSRPRTAQPQK